mmetsp:Transcript_29711/g.88346  ORF Transcript_29711/g.88346 Transcript_29711/m.88346 type:complete len:206 (+) Transcript_29711:2-619(+)
MVKDNNYLGRFTLKDLPKTLRGVPKIRVTFGIDSNGILAVTAEDMKSHNKSQIHITNEKGRLTQSQIDKMLEEAEKNKEFDDLARGEMVAKEALRQYMSRTQKALADIDQAKIATRDRERLEKKLEDVGQWLETGAARAGKEDFEAKQKELATAMNTIMIRINRKHTDFWEQEVVLQAGETTVEKGGFFLESSGLDIRDLIADPD